MITETLQSLASQITLSRVALGLAIFLIGRIILFQILLPPAKHGMREIPTYLPLGIDFIIHSVRLGGRGEGLVFWRWIFQKYGPAAQPYTAAVLTLGTHQTVFTADSDNIKAVLATQFNEYGKGPKFHRDWHEFLGDSIFATDGAMWQKSRHLIRPFFMRERMGDLEIFETHTQKLLAMCGDGGKEVDVMNFFFRFTLDVVTDFLLGATCNSLDNPRAGFATAFADVQRIQRVLVIAGPFSPLVNKRAYNNGLKYINSFMEPYIEQTLAQPLSELETMHKTDTAYTFLSALALLTRDPKVIRDQLVSVLFAGRDTAAATLSWCLYELSGKPDVVARLRAEIMNCVGPGELPSFSHLKSMKYLQAVMSETLRMYPVVPFNMRVALQDTTLPRGGGPDGRDPVAIKEGSTIAYSPLVLQRRSDVYPATLPDGSPFPDPEDFVPERWLQPTKGHGWTPTSWTYIPFNGGPRICLGQQFALTEMGYTLVRMFQKYDRIERRMPRKDWGVARADIVMAPGKPINLALFCPDT